MGSQAIVAGSTADFWANTVLPLVIALFIFWFFIGQPLWEEWRNRGVRAEKRADRLRWAALDEIVDAYTVEATLQFIPEGVREDFTPAGQPCPEAGMKRHKWYRDHSGDRSGWECLYCHTFTSNAKIVDRDEALARQERVELDRKMSAARYEREKRQKRQAIERALDTPKVEIMRFGEEKPVRVWDAQSEIARLLQTGMITPRDAAEAMQSLPDRQSA